jgi:acetyltransferase-like isoleucine patch superfamily enzyme
MTHSRSVSLLGRAYLSLWLYRWTRVVGACSLAFNKLLFPGLQVGARPRVWGWFWVQLWEGGTIEIGDDLHIVSCSPRSALSLSVRCQLTAGPGARIEIGDHVGLNGTTISARKRIRIGSNTMIARDVVIADTDFHMSWPPSERWKTDTSAVDREVTIGENVWIGMNVLILKGVTIGDNALIGAGSVVVSDIPANCTAVGNPARVIATLKPEMETTDGE